ncbi:ferrochelatase [Parachlamydia acanthamoebae]|uniref:Ferrochelatase n=2 Tax=Parachlamydia acanthamoebae TaxID=83552 RepID=F8L1R1_PARAV|nr:ferrochelatase [Parachlamydia acanthamoebae]CCB87218.1 ferrochelatase [Parachlamydia acanthamoebae UV-7]
MDTKSKGYLLVNFGGPRSEDEIRPFLESLLTDQDVIRTRLPEFLHRLFFKRVAKKRAIKISKEYALMGGKSPIYEDTELLAECLREKLQAPLLTFHRYLPSTHAGFIEALEEMECEEIRVLPLFPQFTYATTGSVARWFERYLPSMTTLKMRWIKSYAAYPTFIQAHQEHIRDFLIKNQLQEQEVILLFSAHGIPLQFVETGDLYTDECRASVRAVMQAFPGALGRLAYQSKFGPGEWVKPYTIDVCEGIKEWNMGRKHVVFIPISFTSDHIETLVEIENEYMSKVRAAGLYAYRVPCLTLNPLWIQAIIELFEEGNFCLNQMLVRRR